MLSKLFFFISLGDFIFIIESVNQWEPRFVGLCSISEWSFLMLFEMNGYLLLDTY